LFDAQFVLLFLDVFYIIKQIYVKFIFFAKMEKGIFVSFRIIPIIEKETAAVCLPFRHF
jgi:hypothetical protein